MDVSSTSPFMTLGAAGYAPYPLHTPFDTVILSNPNPRHRRNTSTPSQLQPRASGISHRRTQSAVVPSAPRNPISQNRRSSIYSPPGQLCVRPRRPERIDSGFEDDDNDDKSETSSVTFTFADDVERQFALREFLGQRDSGSGETAYEREDEREESGYESGYESEEGEVGRRARDSIDMNIERAGTWENKETRKRRNRKTWEGRLKVVGRSVGGLMCLRAKGESRG